MIEDANLQMLAAAALPAAVGTTYSNAVDLGSVGTDALGNQPPHDLGLSDVVIDARIIAAATSGGAATLQLALVNDATSGLNSGAAVVLDETQAIPLATLVAGYRFQFSRVPPQATQRYLGIKLICAGAGFTGGTITAQVFPTQFA